MAAPSPPTVIAVFGPTAVGKTALAIAVGERLRARGAHPVAVSADALALYRGLEIITGAPNAAEQAALEHRLVGILDVTETCSAGRYAELAHAEIDGILAAGGTPIVVGGTGLYLRAALAELALRPPPDPTARARWTAAVDADGPAAVHAALAARDPDAAARIAPTDRQRIVRAHELLDVGALVPDGDGRDELWTAATRHPTRLIALVRAREDLTARIDARVDAMIAAGAEREVRLAAAAGASETARAAVGFRELLAGDVAGMKARTRRLAKRQLTWLRKLPDVERVDLTHAGGTAAVADALLSSSSAG